MNRDSRKLLIQYGARKYGGRIFWMVADQIEQTGEVIPLTWFMIAGPGPAEKFIDEGNPRLAWFVTDKKPHIT